MQVDYGFYVNSYGGANLTEQNWKRLSQKATQRLSQFTFGRLPENWEGEPWENQAKCAVCEMAEFLAIQEKVGGKSSENTDGYSVSYDTSKDSGSRQSLYDIACVYLDNSGLMDLEV